MNNNGITRQNGNRQNGNSQSSHWNDQIRNGNGSAQLAAGQVRDGNGHTRINHALAPDGERLRDLADLLAMGDMHVATSIDTPLRADAFLLSEGQKTEIIARHFEEIMRTLGLDLTDDSLSGTPHRVAKMYVSEIFSGLDPGRKPEAKVFENKFQYGEMLVERNISLHTTCEHHFLPIVGKAHVAYISSGTVIGLSKINRIVEYYARRPQVQERLTVQIAAEIRRALDTEDVAVLIDAKHFCVAARGIEDTHSSTVTAEYSGRFKDESPRKEFLRYVQLQQA